MAYASLAQKLRKDGFFPVRHDAPINLYDVLIKDKQSKLLHRAGHLSILLQSVDCNNETAQELLKKLKQELVGKEFVSEDKHPSEALGGFNFRYGWLGILTSLPGVSELVAAVTGTSSKDYTINVQGVTECKVDEDHLNQKVVQHTAHGGLLQLNTGAVGLQWPGCGQHIWIVSRLKFATKITVTASSEGSIKAAVKAQENLNKLAEVGLEVTNVTATGYALKRPDGQRFMYAAALKRYQYDAAGFFSQIKYKQSSCNVHSKGGLADGRSEATQEDDGPAFQTHIAIESIISALDGDSDEEVAESNLPEDLYSIEKDEDDLEVWQAIPISDLQNSANV